MVRLKPIWIDGKIDTIWMFQFHNGSIKTLTFLTFSKLQFLFQFHNGSIKTVVKDKKVLKETRFQFHNGSIKTIEEPDLDNTLKQVSIPQWFD